MRKLSTMAATGAVVAALMLAPAAMAALSDKGPSSGGLSSDTIEYIGHIPISTDGVGGEKLGKYFYTNDQNKIMIFDVSTPEDPDLVGVLPMPQEAVLSREDLDTNGKLMLVPNTVTGVADGSPPSGGTSATNALYIVDVEDKANPKIISKVNGAAQHTFSCVLNCKWAYGSDGNIVDLRDPTKPKLTEQGWGDDLPTSNGHDVDEVAPGIVLTATQPMMLIDIRKDPLRPKLLALGANRDGRFMHSVAFPNRTKDKFVLSSGETLHRRACTDNVAPLMTWDATQWKKTHTFQMIDEYRMRNGTYVDGNPAANAMGCSSHWLEEHPKFENGGLVAAAFWEHGTRIVDVQSSGKIKEVGWFMPWGGETGATYWINDRIIYAVDYTRGIDILRYTGKL